MCLKIKGKSARQNDFFFVVVSFPDSKEVWKIVQVVCQSQGTTEFFGSSLVVPTNWTLTLNFYPVLQTGKMQPWHGSIEANNLGLPTIQWHSLGLYIKLWTVLLVPISYNHWLIITGKQQEFPGIPSQI